VSNVSQRLPAFAHARSLVFVVARAIGGIISSGEGAAAHCAERYDQAAWLSRLLAESEALSPDEGRGGGRLRGLAAGHEEQSREVLRALVKRRHETLFACVHGQCVTTAADGLSFDTVGRRNVCPPRMLGRAFARMASSR